MSKPAHEIRRENFAREVAKFESPSAFAEHYGVNPDYVRQLLKGKGTKNGSGMGNVTARNYEKMLGKGVNWMDQDWSLAPEAIPGEGSRATERAFS